MASQHNPPIIILLRYISGQKCGVVLLGQGGAVHVDGLTGLGVGKERCTDHEEVRDASDGEGRM